MGAMIWGIRSARGGRDRRANARYVNDNLADYLVPVNADIQQLEVISVPDKDNFVNPAGVKASASSRGQQALHRANALELRRDAYRLLGCLPLRQRAVCQSRA